MTFIIHLPINNQDCRKCHLIKFFLFDCFHFSTLNYVPIVSYILNEYEFMNNELGDELKGDIILNVNIELEFKEKDFKFY